MSDLEAIRAGRAFSAHGSHGFLEVAGRDALALLQNTITQDVASLEIGASAPSLMLTPKGRPLADMTVVRLADDAFLAICEPEVQDALAQTLRRYRLASKAAIDDVRPSTRMLEIFGELRPVVADGLAIEGPLGPAVVGNPLAIASAGEQLASRGYREISPVARELHRIEIGVPRFGRDFDESTLPAEAGLTERAIAFEKGCYIGQEPVARLHYRGHPNRRLWRLELDGPIELPATLQQDERSVGRVTSSAVLPDGRVVALGYVRREIDAAGTPLAALGAGESRTARLVGLAGARP